MIRNEFEAMEFPVYVICSTFNQSVYITDTLNGFCMQKTSFPYICIIMDDASTDGEQTVIRNYLSAHFCLDDKSLVREEETDDYVMSYARHKDNHNCYFAVFFLKYNHWNRGRQKEQYYEGWAEKAKYVAFCEGDDYWTAPEKMQKQIDILESNPNINLVHTDFCNVDESGQNYQNPYYEGLRHRAMSDNKLCELFRKNYIMTLTCCCPVDILRSNLYRHCPSGIDYGVFLAAAMSGDVAYMDEKMGCYRKVGTSMVNSHLDIVKLENQKVFHYYARKFFNGEHKPLTDEEYLKTRQVVLEQIAGYHNRDMILYVMRKDTRAFLMLLVMLARKLGKRLAGNMGK